jgi:release factor glutamine methyltransferase
MEISAALKAACGQLESVSDSPRLDAELLMAYCLGQTRSYLYAHPEKTLQSTETLFFNYLIEQRKKSIPIAYLMGEKEFWSLNYKISIHTLIPRPATESLVDYVLQHFPNQVLSVCDLGTGSGALAISLAKHRPQWNITAVDLQAGALAIAQSNARKHKCDNIKFYCSNWFEKLPEKKFDLIISNPPYIAKDDVHLSLGDVQHEPLKALISEQQGFGDLDHLIEESQKYLNPNGMLILEHGHLQQTQVLNAMQQSSMQNIQGHLDEEQTPRFCVGFKSL